MRRQETGKLGEKLARDFLVKDGYSIRETNFRCSYGEMDIIAEKGGCLMFIEVRTKRNRNFGMPEESVTERKKEKLQHVAEFYRQTHENLPLNWRIDFVAVELGRGNVPQRIEVVENAVGG